MNKKIWLVLVFALTSFVFNQQSIIAKVAKAAKELKPTFWDMQGLNNWSFDHNEKKQTFKVKAEKDGTPYIADYKYTPNKRYVESDIEDWNPDGRGEKKRMNCERWNCNSLDWFKLWMQSLPGKNNALTHNGMPLTNWWVFIGDWDYAMEKGISLAQE